MNEFGNFALVTAWILALFGMIGGARAASTRNRSWFLSARNATFFSSIASALAIGTLAVLFLSHDYRNAYVWQFSNRSMEWYYKVSAIWGGMDGSMLLWAFMLSISCAVVALRLESQNLRSAPWVLAVMNSSLLFFLGVVTFLTNPFRYLQSPLIPADGNGLNPLLQNPYMAIHPPTLYAGFTTFSIPFAFCMAALFAKELSNEWIRLTRRWTLIAWAFLTAGIVLGGHWAYIELGWGGFWAWDPVENASFLPWLTGTAFLHSVMVQERKNMLRFWNVWLIVSTYALTVFGTFLTRSGVVQSVHAFAETDIGWIFLVYLGIIFALTCFFTWLRRAELRSERQISSLLSREAFFLLNNLVLLSICFATLWGVLFPVLSEAVTGQKQTVGIPFFNAVNVPLFLLLLFLMGIGPLIAWKRASARSLRDTFLAPFLIGCVASAILVWAGIVGFYPVTSYGLCVFVLLTILGELHRGLRVQRASLPQASTIESVERLVRRHRSRYGGYLVHLGVLVAAISITASMAHKTEHEFSLAQGEKLDIGRFSLTLKDFHEVQNDNYVALIANVEAALRSDGSPVALLSPELRRYKAKDESTSEVALRIGMREDLYLVLAGLDEKGERAALKVFINPLQIWLWVGAVIMVVGAIIVMLPRFQAETISEKSRAEGTVRA